jgi:hypothetical protein
VCGDFDSKPRKTGKGAKSALAKDDLIALKISSRPAWATAEIEGFGSCDTNCTMHLPPGTYVVRARNTELHLKGKARVTLTEDEKVKVLSVQLEEEP